LGVFQAALRENRGSAQRLLVSVCVESRSATLLRRRVFLSRDRRCATGIERARRLPRSHPSEKVPKKQTKQMKEDTIRWMQMETGLSSGLRTPLNMTHQ